MSFIRRTIPTILALLMVGCKGIAYVADPSIQAAEAGDYTLIMSACEGAPGYGMDICRVIAGQPTSQNWTMVLPVDGKNVSGTVSVYYRNLEKDYAVAGTTLTIPWEDLVGGAKVWDSSFDGEALALASITFLDATGVKQTMQFRGIAKLVVTASSYTRLPIDSGLQSWETTCKIQYTASARSAIQCQ